MGQRPLIEMHLKSPPKKKFYTHNRIKKKPVIPDMQKHVTDVAPSFVSPFRIVDDRGIGWGWAEGVAAAKIHAIPNEDDDLDQRNQGDEQRRRTTMSVIFVVICRRH